MFRCLLLRKTPNTILNSAFLCKILIRVSKSAEKKTKKKKKNEKKKEPDEKIFLEENIFPRGKSGKFSLNIFRGLIAC